MGLFKEKERHIEHFVEPTPRWAEAEKRIEESETFADFRQAICDFNLWFARSVDSNSQRPFKNLEDGILGGKRLLYVIGKDTKRVLWLPGEVRKPGQSVEGLWYKSYMLLCYHAFHDNGGRLYTCVRRPRTKEEGFPGVLVDGKLYAV